MRYPDFLRHIVNSKLAEYSNNKSVASIIDEVRKMIAKAEEKYNFSSFGGNPENLAKYLKSADFKLVVSLFKSASKLDVLKEILTETKKLYSELPSVVKAIDEVLPSLAGEEKPLTPENIVENLKKEFPKAKIGIDDNRVSLKLDDVELVIEIGDSTYDVSGTIKLKYSAKTLDELLDYIKNIVSSMSTSGASSLERTSVL